ncbi:MAG: hypothetical protein WBC18_08010 [Ottowia sp.]|uniref:hypothetical protein n=1 Tax=Ottowia sp. TaxID=1898956 RepID=UPI003C750C59
MRERPILFSAPMVRALLNGSKRQTRRIVKSRKDHYIGCDLAPHEIAGEINCGNYRNSRLGEPGDRLWVREAFDFLPAGGPSDPQACEIVYWSTGSIEPRTAPASYNPMIYGREKIRPSIHMPRWASRITLEISAVRVEKLLDISRDDAIAEGIERMEDFFGCPCWKCYGEPDGSDVVCPDDPIGSYRSLWESINGRGSWDFNPWVWVIEFNQLPEGKCAI